MRDSQIFGEVHRWIIETVCANASGGQQVIDGVDVDVNCVLVEFVQVRLCCP